MLSTPRSVLPGLVAGLLVSTVSFLFIVSWVRPTLPEISIPTVHALEPHASSQTTPSWTFNVERDRNAHALSHDQCASAFPLAYTEIDRSVKFWAGGVTPEAINITERKVPQLRLMIYDQQLYILQAKGVFALWAERMIGMLGQIHRAIVTSPEPIPNVEFSMSVKDDCPTPKLIQNAIWNFNRRAGDTQQEALWLMPAFSHWAWKDVAGSYAPYQKMMLETDTLPITEKIPKAVWRGAVSVNNGLREPLVKAAKDQSWADVSGIDWDNKKELKSKWISMPDHCNYAFPIYTEGTTWSGRLKYLLNCHSALVMPPSEWITPIHHLFSSGDRSQNYIPVHRNWTDLGEQMNFYIAHKEEAQMIADNSVATFRDRYLTPAAEACYWRRLFKSYATVAFKPDLYESIRSGDLRQRKLRGITYEEWLLKPVDYKPHYAGEKDF